MQSSDLLATSTSVLRSQEKLLCGVLLQLQQQWGALLRKLPARNTAKASAPAPHEDWSKTGPAMNQSHLVLRLC